MVNQFIEKWKKGILSVTELQKIKTQINSTWIVMIGIILGLIVMFFNAKNFWWLIIILIGALFNTAVQLLGLYQKKVWLVKIENIQKEV